MAFVWARGVRWLATRFANGLHVLPPAAEQRLRSSRPFRVTQRFVDHLTRPPAEADPSSLAPLCILPWIHTHIGNHR